MWNVFVFVFMCIYAPTQPIQRMCFLDTLGTKYFVLSKMGIWTKTGSSTQQNCCFSTAVFAKMSYGYRKCELESINHSKIYSKDELGPCKIDTCLPALFSKCGVVLMWKSQRQDHMHDHIFVVGRGTDKQCKAGYSKHQQHTYWALHSSRNHKFKKAC